MYRGKGFFTFSVVCAFFFSKLVPTIACPGATTWHYRMLGSLGALAAAAVTTGETAAQVEAAAAAKENAWPEEMSTNSTQA